MEDIDMLSEVDILTATKAALKSVRAIPVYIDDYKENFKAPCWFVKLDTTRAMISKYRCRNVCSLMVTYFSQLNDTSALELYRLKSDIQDSLWRGLTVKDRHMNFDSVQSNIISDDADIVQTDLHFEYIDAVDDNESSCLIQHVYDDGAEV